MRTFRTVGGSAAHRLHDEGIVLPTHCGLTRDDAKTVCEALERCSA
jgi:dTDP-4-amino-4,6-dideoxygalactose transaminase